MCKKTFTSHQLLGLDATLMQFNPLTLICNQLPQVANTFSLLS